MVTLNMDDPWITMYQGVDEVEQVVHRYHRMEEEEQQDPLERQQLASIFGGDGADYKPESGSSSNYHREPPKYGRPYSTLCNVCPTYVYDDDEEDIPLSTPKIKKEDNRDWHEEPPKNGEPYTVLETDPPSSECFVFGCGVDCKDASFCVWADYCCRVCVASTRRGSKGNELEARC